MATEAAPFSLLPPLLPPASLHRRALLQPQAASTAGHYIIAPSLLLTSLCKPSGPRARSSSRHNLPCTAAGWSSSRRQKEPAGGIHPSDRPMRL